MKRVFRKIRRIFSAGRDSVERVMPELSAEYESTGFTESARFRKKEAVKEKRIKKDEDQQTGRI